MVLRSETDMGVHKLTEIRDVINEVIRMHELNSELLKTLLLMGYKINDYATIHNISMLDNNFYSLLRKAEVLINEISSDLPKSIETLRGTIRRKKTLWKSDVDETEPQIVMLIY